MKKWCFALFEKSLFRRVAHAHALPATRELPEVRELALYKQTEALAISSTRSMHDAMQVVFGHIFSGKPWPFPLACVPWKVKDSHHTLTLKPYRDLVKAALVCKDTHTLFKKFIEAKIWDDEDPYCIFADVFAQSVDWFSFHTWKDEAQATTRTMRFSVCLYDTFFVGATLICRATAPDDASGVHEIATQYGVTDAGMTDAALVTTVPASQYVRGRKRTLDQVSEVVRWKVREGDALLAFLKAEHTTFANKYHI